MNDESDETNKVEVTNRSTTPPEPQPEPTPVIASEEPSPAFTPDVEREEIIVPPPAPKEPKKSSSSKKWLVWGVVAVLLVGMGALTYYFYAASQTDKQRADTATSNIDAANTTIANLRTQLSKALATEDTTTQAPTEEEAVKNVAIAWSQTFAGSETTKFTVKTVKFSKTNPIFATTSVTYPPGSAVLTGPGLYLKKANGLWVVIASSQNPLSQDVIKQFGIPKDVTE